MYTSRITQLMVGTFAILGIIALGILSMSLGKIPIRPAPGYILYADFDNVSGLKTGDQVQLYGVQVGKVMDIGIKENHAIVALRLNEGVDVDPDAIASIKTSGIIGDKYVTIAPGADSGSLSNGETIHKTQSVIVIEDIIADFVNNFGNNNSDSSKSSNSNSACADTTSVKKIGQSGKEVPEK